MSAGRKANVIGGIGVVVLLFAAVSLLSGCGRGDGVGTAPESARQPEGSATPEIAQKLCPVMMGSPIDKSVYVDHEGRRVYFCCQACVGPFKEDPARYLAILDEQMSGETASPEESHSHESHSH